MDLLDDRFRSGEGRAVVLRARRRAQRLVPELLQRRCAGGAAGEKVAHHQLVFRTGCRSEDEPEQDFFGWVFHGSSASLPS